MLHRSDIIYVMDHVFATHNYAKGEACRKNVQVRNKCLSPWGVGRCTWSA
jgi:hypothetical protein